MRVPLGKLLASTMDLLRSRDCTLQLHKRVETITFENCWKPTLVSPKTLLGNIYLTSMAQLRYNFTDVFGDSCSNCAERSLHIENVTRPQKASVVGSVMVISSPQPSENSDLLLGMQSKAVPRNAASENVEDASVPSGNKVPLLRLVCYVCMTPTSFASEEVIRKRFLCCCLNSPTGDLPRFIDRFFAWCDLMI